MVKRDLVVSFLSSVPSYIMSMFQNPPLVLACPVTQGGGGGYPGGRAGYRKWLSEFRDGDGNVIPRMFRKAGGSKSDSIGRVAVIGFSNGCIGVDETLGMGDAFQIDTVIACDGIHGQYSHLPQHMGEKVVNTARYKNFYNYGLYVARHNPEEHPGAPNLLVTHSSIIPGAYPSTTETAYFIWNKVAGRAPASALTAACGYLCPPVERIEKFASIKYEGDDRICCGMNGCHQWNGFADSWYSRRSMNNFMVWGWGDWKNGKIVTRDPQGYADHIFQGQRVLGSALEVLLVDRWNRSCGPQAIAMQGFGNDISSRTRKVCKPSQGLVYGSGGEKEDFFPEIGESQLTPSPAPQQEPAIPCPAPPPGFVFIGSANDPCAMAPLFPDGNIPAGDPSDLSLSPVKVAVGVAGFAAGIIGVKMLLAL